jgi:hypothetical protein
MNFDRGEVDYSNSIKCLTPQIAEVPLTPLFPVPDAPAVIHTDDDVALLDQVLVKTVIHGVVALDVPAVIVLVHAVAVNPNEGRMTARRVEPRRNEQVRGNAAAVGRGVVHELRFDQRRVQSRPAASRSVGEASPSGAVR